MARGGFLMAALSYRDPGLVLEFPEYAEWLPD